MHVFPDFGGVGAAGDLRTVVGALLTIVLFGAVLMLIVCSVAWALAASSGLYHATTKARAGVWAAVGTAVLAGAGVAWANFLLDVGSRF